MTKRQQKRISFAESLIREASPPLKRSKALKSVLKVREAAADSYRSDLPLEKVTLLNTPELAPSALARGIQSPFHVYLRDEQNKFYNKIVRTGLLDIARPTLAADVIKRIESALEISDYEILAAIARSGRFAVEEYTETFEDLFETVAIHVQNAMQSHADDEEVDPDSPRSSGGGSDSTIDSPAKSARTRCIRAKVRKGERSKRPCVHTRRRQQRLARLRQVGFFR